MTLPGLVECFNFGFGVGVVLFGAAVGFIATPATLSLVGCFLASMTRKKKGKAQ